MKLKFSEVTIRETEQQKKIRITSDIKPVIISSLIEKWQTLIDLAAEIVNVPSGLIMKLNENTIEVFLKSKTEGNPYEVGEEAKLVYGLYCETVIGTQSKLLVPDARKSMVWKDNNPDADIDMISYLGYPINWPDGEVFGTVCILDNKENHYNKKYFKLLNLTKLHIEADLQLLVSRQEIEKNNKQLEELNTTKDKFFSIISHDLRSPFMVILGYSDILMQEHDKLSAQKRVDYIKPIIQSANKAYELVENLLEWSSIQTGAISFNPEPVEIDWLIEEAVSQVLSSAIKKDISLNYEKKINLEVLVDVLMINTVLRNLITNAIKFTHSKGKIIIRTVRKGDKLEVAVEDNGIGMSKDLIQKIFKISEHTITQGTDGEEGTGLGLSLCKEFIETHKGEIRVESEEGKGSIFSFTLPL